MSVTDAHRLKVKEMLIERLHLKVAPAQIDDRAPLFLEGLGLDSIDALEVVVAVEQTFKVRIDGEKEGRIALGSVDALARFLVEKGGLTP